jgi:hypothetical protein
MGASGWSYFVPYEADISAALQRLREDVFARGDYVYGSGVTEEQEKEAMAHLVPHTEQWIADLIKRSEDPAVSEFDRSLSKHAAEQLGQKLIAMLKPRKRPEKPKSIDELLEAQAESGTHSILDIVCVSPRRKFGAIRPFPSAKVLELFGTETPSHAQIEEAYEFGSLEEYLSERWEGIYIVAHRDGKPDEIFFAGCSGD